MKEIQAPNDITKVALSNSPTIFLAGGITDCIDWQTQVITMLRPYDVIVFNPRRANFPIHNPNAAREQIEWEFKAIANADIFSMWFEGGQSDQPICMYEYGRNLALNPNRIVVGVNPNYKRAKDVYIQTELACKGIKISNSLEEHVKMILKKLNQK